ncbi:twin-arginine translocase TatA/TatE family subunit [Trichlorobacter lovleyi]|uniref:twin-arginine translocase TatA/TatE family subunit n=1 Tax=Trichlorobacter lovleyi TaxID=313985 RepID=UPI0023F3E16E|nr:twin-arginine translocase TatA/TatE family subunit [Trichlorobacter lovleyi]
MFGFGMPELIVIGAVLLLVFGPSKLPQFGASLGGAIRSFRKASDEVTSAATLESPASVEKEKGDKENSSRV